ncbi:hypothetical protein F8M41_010282 [Gigaspora margarita]|uniref:F-box domain-containing protein n=1 Tax=Gigaspora margarita TaxID=4874 RepID=A0A8H4A1E0_GIGMA|nr:hypothetical protein F8M41_010282 [Gigaspora margarita]
MRNYIPPECLQLIFDNIENDRISLHSCLLVNRTWCYNIISILWKQPFHLLYACNKNSSVKRNLQATNLLEVYISCLIQQNKSILMEKSIVSQFIKPPMFNYVQYLKFLDLYELYMAIYDYKDPKINGKISRFPLTPKFNSVSRRRFPINQQLDNSTHWVTSEDCMLVLNFFFRENFFDLGSSINNDEYRWLGMLMCKFFLEHSRSIDKLSIDSKSGFSILTLANQNFISNRKYLNVDDCLIIPTCLDSSNCLSKLTKLVCTTRYRKANFLLNIANICHCIKTLIVRVDCDITYSWPLPLLPTSRNGEHESVAKLIKSQRGLVHLELQYCSSGLGNIMSALKSQVHSLRILHFTDIDLSYILNYLTPLTNLDTLQFQKCYSTRADFSLDLMINLSKLSTLHFDEVPIPLKIVEIIIDACSFNLRSINLGRLLYTPDLDGAINMNTIGFVASRFHNLTFFKTNIDSKEQIPQVIELFKTCSYLETVILCQVENSDKSLSVYETNNMLETLGKNGLPTTLRCFALKGKQWTFTCVSLGIFLGHHDVSKRKSPVFELDLTGGSYCFTNYHLDAILNANRHKKVVKKVLLSSNMMLLSSEMMAKAGELIKLVNPESDKIVCNH